MNAAESHKPSIRSTGYFTLVFLVLFAAVFMFRQITSNSKPLNRDINNGVISGEFDANKFRTEEEWKKILTREQYGILRLAQTEIPFSGELNDEKRNGTYYSAGCDVPVFRSETKFDSGTGWPSFTAPISESAVVLRRESYPDERIEVLDPCGGHLGHVFDDGPPPTGKRYCINSAALHFKPD